MASGGYCTGWRSLILEMRFGLNWSSSCTGQEAIICIDREATFVLLSFVRPMATYCTFCMISSLFLKPSGIGGSSHDISDEHIGYGRGWHERNSTYDEILVIGRCFFIDLIHNSNPRNITGKLWTRSLVMISRHLRDIYNATLGHPFVFCLPSRQKTLARL